MNLRHVRDNFLLKYIILVNLKELNPLHQIQLLKTFHKTTLLTNREEGPLCVRAVRDNIFTD